MKVTLDDIIVTKTGNSEGGEDCNLIGLNAAVLVNNGVDATISNANISSSAVGANAVFSYGGNGGTYGAAGDGTIVNIIDSTIYTDGLNSGGIMASGGGIMNATDLTVSTYGQFSAPIKSYKGGGEITVNGGTYTANGVNSPAVYSKADISISDATLVSKVSEGVIVEGNSTLTLYNTTVTANNIEKSENSEIFSTIKL